MQKKIRGGRILPFIVYVRDVRAECRDAGRQSWKSVQCAGSPETVVGGGGGGGGDSETFF